MVATGRLPDAVLVQVLYRLSVAVGAGVDLRRAWASEVGRVPRRCRPAVAAVAARLDAGEGLGSACTASGGAIRDDVAAMLEVGDRTGRLADVLAGTSRMIARSLAARRSLRAALAGPAVRLALAIGVVAVIRGVAGRVRGIGGAPVDPPGPGPLGAGGLAVLLAGVGAVLVILVAVVLPGRRRGWPAVVPILGRLSSTAEAAAWCRAAALAAHAGIGVGETVELASRAAPGCGCDRRRIEHLLRGGHDLAGALAAVGRLPRCVIEAVVVGEAGGTTAEALDRVADQLDEAAARGTAAAVRVAGFVAWALVACLVATVIVRVAAMYAGLIHDLAGRR